MKQLRFSSPLEEKADRLITEGKVKIDYSVKDDILNIRGTIKDNGSPIKQKLSLIKIND
jgi:hypothetical protein